MYVRTMEDLLVWMAPLADSDLLNGNVEREQTSELLQGRFSTLMDLGTNTTVHSIRVDGQAGDGGKVHLQYRIASESDVPADPGVFGGDMVVNEIPLGSLIPVDGEARWVWIRLSLDDREADDASAPATVTDVTVGEPIPPPAAPPPPPPPPSPPPPPPSEGSDPDVENEADRMGGAFSGRSIGTGCGASGSFGNGLSLLAALALLAVARGIRRRAI
ncbi:MAG: hypothetical protein HY716_00075 [Planctomycetes bacterium]|nr:hypothetical protein [Planctomycetota bacterium]